MSADRTEVPMMLTIERAGDLQPMDQVDEGVFISKLICLLKSGDPEWQWVVAPACWEAEYIDGHDEPLRRPVWGDPVDMPMRFPMRVVRGSTPPPCGSKSMQVI